MGENGVVARRSAATKLKDPKKVKAGKKGGTNSGANFKRNKERAKIAGQRSAWNKASGLLEDFPSFLLTPELYETPLDDPDVPPRKDKKKNA